MKYTWSQNCNKKQPGFTLIELLVVVSIIVILGAGILTAVFNARKESRDMSRATTAEQLKLAVRLYKDAKGVYPDYASGAEITTTSAVGLQLIPYIKTFTNDTLRADGYEYWYDSSFDCTQAGQRVIFMKTLEFAENSNFNSVCGAGDPSNLPNGWDRTRVFVTVIN